MKLPDYFKAIRARYLAAFPLWSMPASTAADDRARRWTIGLMEQVAFEHPNDGWGVKRGDRGRPIGKDTAANNKLSLGRLLIWDLMTGAGTGTPKLNDDPNSEDVTGQFFETRPEFFKPQNHLGVPVPDQPPAPPPPTAPVDLSQVLQRVADLERDVAALRSDLQVAAHRAPPPWPAYRASLWGFKIISRAEE